MTYLPGSTLARPAAQRKSRSGRHWIPCGVRASTAEDVAEALALLLIRENADYATAGQLRAEIHGSHDVRTAAMQAAVAKGLILEDFKGNGWPKWFSLPGDLP